MLTCPDCGTTNLVKSIIVEKGLNTHYTITKNPKNGNPTLVARGIDNIDASYTLICTECGAESEVDDAVFTIAKK